MTRDKSAKKYDNITNILWQDNMTTMIVHDIRELAFDIIASVREKFGIELHPEVNIL